MADVKKLITLDALSRYHSKVLGKFKEVKDEVSGKADLQQVKSLSDDVWETHYMYGVEWDSETANPDVTRIGNMDLHRSLPIHSLMRGCLLNDDGEVVKYLDENDWTGEQTDGSMGQVMVELPEFYWKFEEEGNIQRVKMSLKPISTYERVPKRYVSAYEATVDRTTTTLASVKSEDVRYRGGNNNAAWDELAKSQLGTPATSLSLTNFRAYARKRKAGEFHWNCMTWEINKELYWLFVVEFATRNSQKAINANLTSEGYRQGGLGSGVTNVNGTTWNAYNAYYPFVKCGYTDSLGNGTGDVALEVTDGTNTMTTSVPRYRGIENPFGHLWKWVDGVLIRVQSNADGGESQVWKADDTEHYSSTSFDGYSFVGNEKRVNGYVKEIHFPELSCSELQNSSAEFYCDYTYCNIPESGTAIRGFLFGGSAHSGSAAGFVCSPSYNAPSFAYAYLGSRLCYME